MSGPPSGVKEKMPLKPSSISALAQGRQEVLAVLPGGHEVFQGEVQPGGHAVLGHLLGADPAAARPCPPAWGGGA